jgi:hypothetical protein
MDINLLKIFKELKNSLPPNEPDRTGWCVPLTTRAYVSLKLADVKKYNFRVCVAPIDAAGPHTSIHLWLECQSRSKKYAFDVVKGEKYNREKYYELLVPTGGPRIMPENVVLEAHKNTIQWMNPDYDESNDTAFDIAHIPSWNFVESPK